MSYESFSWNVGLAKVISIKKPLRIVAEQYKANMIFAMNLLLAGLEML